MATIYDLKRTTARISRSLVYKHLSWSSSSHRHKCCSAYRPSSAFCVKCLDKPSSSIPEGKVFFLNTRRSCESLIEGMHFYTRALCLLFHCVSWAMEIFCLRTHVCRLCDVVVWLVDYCTLRGNWNTGQCNDRKFEESITIDGLWTAINLNVNT